MRQFRSMTLLFIVASLCTSVGVSAQTQNPPPPPPQAQQTPPPQPSPNPQTQAQSPTPPPSLGDVARKYREEKAEKEKNND